MLVIWGIWCLIIERDMARREYGEGIRGWSRSTGSDFRVKSLLQKEAMLRDERAYNPKVQRDAVKIMYRERLY